MIRFIIIFLLFLISSLGAFESALFDVKSTTNQTESENSNEFPQSQLRRRREIEESSESDNEFHKERVFAEIIRMISLREDTKFKGEAYTDLFEQMKQSNFMGKPIIFELAYKIREVLMTNESFEWKTSETKENFVNFGNIKSSVGDEAIDQLAKLIQSGKVNEARKSSKYSSGAFSLIIAKLTRKSFNNDIKNFNNLIKLNKVVFWMEHSGKLIETLYAEMEANGFLDSPELVVLAYYVWRTQKDTFGSYSTFFEPLKQKFPVGIKALYWNENVKLKSLALFMNFANDDFNPRVTETDTSWKIGKHHKGKYFSFKFIANDTMLYVNKNGEVSCEILNFAEDRPESGEKVNDINDAFLWRIRPIKNGSAFLIENKASYCTLGINNLVQDDLDKTILQCKTLLLSNLAQRWMFV